MRYGLLTPMPSELRPVVKSFGLQKDQVGELAAHTATHGDDTFVATLTGIGMSQATAATRRLLDHGEVDHVLVIGIAGGLGDIEVRDLLVPAVVTAWPVNGEFRAAPLGDAPAVGRLVSSDEYAYPPEVVAGFVEDGVLGVDMETAAIAAACEERGRPWSAFRGISDPADVDSVDPELITLTNPDGTPNVKASIKYLARRPGRLPGLIRLGLDATAASRVAALAAAAACGVSAGG